MSNPQERRDFWRAPFHTLAQLTDASGTWPARLLDLSLKGALLEMSADWRGACGDPFQLKLDLSEDVSILMKGTVAHVDGRRTGLRCNDIDIDSVTHLRRLVELNACDPALLERELAALLHAA